MSFYERIRNDYNVFLESMGLSAQKTIDENVLSWLEGPQNVEYEKLIRALGYVLSLSKSYLPGSTGLLFLEKKTYTVDFNINNSSNLFMSLTPVLELKETQDPVVDKTVFFLNILFGVKMFLEKQRDFLASWQELTQEQQTLLQPFFTAFQQLTLPKVLKLPYYTRIHQIVQVVKSGVRLEDDVRLFVATMVPFIDKVSLFIEGSKNYIKKPQLCFQIKGNLKNDPTKIKEYKCKLHQRKCHAENCLKWVDIGYPYCTRHLKTKLYLKVLDSTVLNAGKGVFAWRRDMPKNVVFKKGDRVCEYEGEVITQTELDKRYSFLTATYVMQSADTVDDNVPENLYVDSACLRSIGAMINHSNTPNCVVQLQHTNNQTKLVVTATKQIKHKQELFINYERNNEDQEKYFNEDVRQTHSTEKCVE